MSIQSSSAHLKSVQHSHNQEVAQAAQKQIENTNPQSVEKELSDANQALQNFETVLNNTEAEASRNPLGKSAEVLKQLYVAPTELDKLLQEEILDDEKLVGKGDFKPVLLQEVRKDNTINGKVFAPTLDQNNIQSFPGDLTFAEFDKLGSFVNNSSESGSLIEKRNAFLQPYEELRQAFTTTEDGGIKHASSQVRDAAQNIREAHKALKEGLQTAFGFEGNKSPSRFFTIENLGLKSLFFEDDKDDTVDKHNKIFSKVFANATENLERALRAQTVDQYIKLNLFLSFAKDIRRDTASISSIRTQKQERELLNSLAEALGIDEVLKELGVEKLDAIPTFNKLLVVERRLKEFEQNSKLPVEIRELLDSTSINNLKQNLTKSGYIARSGKVNISKSKQIKAHIERSVEKFSKLETHSMLEIDSDSPNFQKLFSKTALAKDAKGQEFNIEKLGEDLAQLAGEFIINNSQRTTAYENAKEHFNNVVSQAEAKLDQQITEQGGDPEKLGDLLKKLQFVKEAALVKVKAIEVDIKKIVEHRNLTQRVVEHRNLTQQVVEGINSGASSASYKESIESVLKLTIDRHFSGLEVALKEEIKDLKEEITTKDQSIKNREQTRSEVVGPEKKNIQDKKKQLTSAINNNGEQLARLEKEIKRLEKIAINLPLEDGTLKNEFEGEILKIKKSQNKLLEQNIELNKNLIETNQYSANPFFQKHEQSVIDYENNDLTKLQTSLADAKKNLRYFERDKKNLANTLSQSYVAQSQLISATQALNTAISAGKIEGSDGQIVSFAANLKTAKAAASKLSDAFANTIVQKITTAKVELYAATKTAFSAVIGEHHNVRGDTTALQGRLAVNARKIQLVEDSARSQIDKVQELFNKRLQEINLRKAEITADGRAEHQKVNPGLLGNLANLRRDNDDALDSLTSIYNKDLADLKAQRAQSLELKDKYLKANITHLEQQLTIAKSEREILRNQSDPIGLRIVDLEKIEATPRNLDENKELTDKKLEMLPLVAKGRVIASRIEGISAAIKKLKSDSKESCRQIRAGFDTKEARLLAKFTSDKKKLATENRESLAAEQVRYNAEIARINANNEERLSPVEKEQKDNQEFFEYNTRKINTSEEKDLASLTEEKTTISITLEDIEGLNEGLRGRLTRLGSQLKKLEASKEDELEVKSQNKGAPLNEAFDNYRKVLSFDKAELKALKDFKEELKSENLPALSDATDQQAVDLLKAHRDELKVSIEKLSDPKQIDAHDDSAIDGFKQAGSDEERKVLASEVTKAEENRVTSKQNGESRIEQINRLILVHEVDSKFLEVENEDLFDFDDDVSIGSSEPKKQLTDSTSSVDSSSFGDSAIRSSASSSLSGTDEKGRLAQQKKVNKAAKKAAKKAAREHQSDSIGSHRSAPNMNGNY